MDSLTIFGLFAVTAMMLFYAVEDRSPWFVLAFAGSCVLGSVYGFLQGGMAIRSGGRRLVRRGSQTMVAHDASTLVLRALR